MKEIDGEIEILKERSKVLNKTQRVKEKSREDIVTKMMKDVDRRKKQKDKIEFIKEIAT